MTDPIAARISLVFNQAFMDTHQTVLCGGGAEPLYAPATDSTPARIVFTHDYPASALHEAAHWCLAGSARRRLRDYGYWYVPGPRDAPQRAAFFAAEADVQAVEAIFASACAVRFVVSADDFAAAPTELAAFESCVAQRVAARRSVGLPPRARRFYAALAAAFADERR